MGIESHWLSVYLGQNVEKGAKFQNKGVKNTKSLILGEIFHFVYSNFKNMLYTLVGNENNTN